MGNFNAIQFSHIPECYQRDQFNNISWTAGSPGRTRWQSIHFATEFPRWHNQFEVATRSQNDTHSNTANHSDSIEFKYVLRDLMSNEKFYLIISLISFIVFISDPQISTTSQAIKPPNTATSDS